MQMAIAGVILVLQQQKRKHMKVSVDVEKEGISSSVIAHTFCTLEFTWLHISELAGILLSVDLLLLLSQDL